MPQHIPLSLATYFENLDTSTTKHLSVVEYGAYALLLGEYWRRQGPIPDAPSLHALTRTQASGEYADSWPVVRAALLKVFRLEDGLLHLEWMDEIISRMQTEREAMIDGAKQTNDRRWAVDDSKLLLDVATGKTTIEQEFEVFWELYPRKEAKKRAFQAYRRALREVTPTLLFEAVKLAKLTDAWNKDGGIYVPHASSWLNGRRWIEYDIRNQAKTRETALKGKVFTIGNRHYGPDRGPQASDFPDQGAWRAAVDAWEIWAARQ